MSAHGLIEDIKDPLSVDSPITDTDLTGAKSDPNPGTVNTSGLIEDAVGDINKMTAGDSLLMRGADTRALQDANSMGLANSSMAVGAKESARLDTVMPLVERRMDYSGQGLIQDDQQDFTGSESALDRDQQAKIQNDQQYFLSGEAALDRTQQTDLMDQEFAGKGGLIALEGKWDAYIQSGINGAAVWQTGLDAIGDILNNKDLTPDQMQAAIEEYTGYYEDKDGNRVNADTPGATYAPGIINASMDFFANLDGWSPEGATDTVDPATGETVDNGPSTSTTDAAAYAPGIVDPVSATAYASGNKPPGAPETEPEVGSRASIESGGGRRATALYLGNGKWEYPQGFDDPSTQIDEEKVWRDDNYEDF